MTIDERLRLVADWIGMDLDEVKATVSQGGLLPAAADALVEDVIGTYGLPFAIAPNFLVNGRDVLVPMVVEEPSVVAAAANAAKMVREGGGFLAECDEPLMACQIQVSCQDIHLAAERILRARQDLLGRAAEVDKKLLELGGGPREIEVRRFDEHNFLVVHLFVDVRDAMGANTVNTMGEAIAPLLAKLTGGQIGLRILTNLADRRLVRVRARVPKAALAMDGFSPEEVRDGVQAASLFAEVDPYRAATHNKGIMNGLDAVVIATGNDWRAVEAGAHAYAARDGHYRPLCTWRVDGEDLSGYLEMPLAVGMVGGATRVHPGARLAIRVLGAKSAKDVAMAAACAGVANNLAALRALATEGIQRGHMRLHERSRSLER